MLNEADPNRCKGKSINGQCTHQAVPGSDFCPKCAGDLFLAEKYNHRQYQLLKAERRRRLTQLADHDEIKSLRDDIGVARMLIEERLNAIKDHHDLVSACGPINQLLLTVERLVKSAHILEQNLGVLLSRDTVVQLANALGEIMVAVLREAGVPNYEELTDEVFQRYAESLREARNDQPTRGMRLLAPPSK